MNKDQQLLAEAYKQVQVNESIVVDVLNWINSVTGANQEMLRTLYVKDLIDILVTLGFSAAMIIVAVLIAVKNKIPDWVDNIMAVSQGKRIKAIVDKLKDNEEVQSHIDLLKNWKEDQSKEGVLRRKAAAERLKEMIKEAGSDENDDTVDRALDTLKYS